jgi:hypothetical protein
MAHGFAFSHGMAMTSQKWKAFSRGCYSLDVLLPTGVRLPRCHLADTAGSPLAGVGGHSRWEADILPT